MWMSSLLMCRMYVVDYYFLMFLHSSFGTAVCDNDHTRMPLWTQHGMNIEARDATGAMTAADVACSSS